MHYVYILYSKSINKYYIGETADIYKRLDKHNSGGSRYTKRGIPWKLMYCEEYSNRSSALKREKEIKSKKSRYYIENIISGNCPES